MAKKKLPKWAKTILSWFTKDANGQINRSASTLFIGAVLTPFMLFEGVKIGLYDKYNTGANVGLQNIVEGLPMPFISVLKMKGNGFNVGHFNPQYIAIFLLLHGFVVTMSYISAEMMKNKSVKKDGDMRFASADEYNARFSYHNKDGEPIDPEEPTTDVPGNSIVSKKLRYNLAGTSDTYSCALVVGSIGSRKSFSYVKPNIMQMNASFVCTDPKTELIRDTGKMLEQNGYTVKLFNLKKGEQQFSCGYNPFAYIRDEQDVILTVDAFLDAATEEKGNGGDPFFPIAEKNFYYALFYYVFTKHRDMDDGSVGTLREVYELYSKAKEEDTPARRTKEQQAQQIENEFDKTFREVSERDPSNPSLSFYNTFKNGSPKTKQSILISVGIKMWFLSVPETANLLAEDTLELNRIGERKTALFIAIPTDNTSFRCISAMLFTQLFQELYYNGETLNSKTYVLKKGLCVAARSSKFIDGTASENAALEELKKTKEMFQTADIVYEEDLAKEDTALKAQLEMTNALGIKRMPKYLVRDKDKNVIESFVSKVAAEEFLDAGKNGTICRVSGLAVRVRFLLDEFFAIGKIAGFEQKIATFRSVKISADIIVQGLEQLKDMYDDHEGKITGCCDIKICLGVNTYEDAKVFSDMAGQTTVRAQSVNIKNNMAGTMPEGGSLSDNAQMLIRPEWLLNKMGGGEMLVLTRTMYPVIDKKYDAPEHPNWKYTFNDHDPERTKENRYPIRRVFCIEQKKENQIKTIIKRETPAQALPSPRPDRPMSSSHNVGMESPRNHRDLYPHREANDYRSAVNTSVDDHVDHPDIRQGVGDGEIQLENLNTAMKEVVGKKLQEGAFKEEITENGKRIVMNKTTMDAFSAYTDIDN